MSDTQTVAGRMADYLRARFPRDTAKQVAGLTGLPPTTVGKWLTRSSAPSAGALLTLVAAFGPEFLIAVCPGLDWAEFAHSVTRREALAQALDRAEAEAAATLDGLRSR